MLSPVWHLIFLLSIIRCCVASLDFGIQVGELLPSLNAEPNNLFLPSESAGGTDTRESSELSLTQSNDQCRYNTNQKSRKMRSKRGEFCSPLREPFKDNGRSRIEQPSQVVPPASETPASINSIQQPHTDDNLCPPAARYPVCADPLAFPITPNALFHHDPSRMQLQYCRTCTYTINPSLQLYIRRRQILVRC